MAGIGDIVSGAAAGSALGPIGAIGGALLGGVQLFSSMAKEKRDKAELNSLEKPFYKIQDEYNQNRNLDAGIAGGGMAAGQQDYYTSESQRGLGAGVGGSLQSGGNPNDIAKLFGIYDKGIDKTYAESAEQHIKNIQYFKESNKELAGQKTTQWAINQYQPYQNKVAQLTGNIAANQQNAYSGAQTALGSITALGTGLENNALLANLLKGTKDDSGGLNPYTKLDTTRIPNM